MQGNHRGLLAFVATLIAGALAISGTAAIAVALTIHEFGPQAPLSIAPLPAGISSMEPSSAHDSWPAFGPLMPPSPPVAVDIPSIGVRSPLHPLGMTAQRTLQVPSGERYDEAAWYQHSVTPGARGPAVILGHVDSRRHGPSVFFKLSELRRGDTIRIARADGRIAVFAVDAVRRYPKDQFPTRLVYGDTRHAALRLITCGGAFDRAAGHYVENVVVFASLIGSMESSPTTRSH